MLRAAVATWFGVAMLGQLAFAAYVVGLYGGAALSGQAAHWNRVTPRAWVPGEPVGNLVFASHVAFTVAILLGGLIQLLPPLRRRAPALHRWNGRLYLAAAVVLALGGIAMLLTRGTVGGIAQQAGTAVNGLAILACAALAWRAARAGRTAEHRRWALRLFLCVGGVWFFRIGLMAWLMVFQAPVGFDPTSFSGPFLTVLAFAQFLLPLLVLEGVLRAEAGARPGARRAMAAVVFALAALTALGVAGAVMGMWLPRL
ncbi:putative membrane protein [Piscinibacter sakaiensis]|uniref:Putative membrane protein n=1 Tax=Piscinibacter sakaiensis TaxID=1547922 RepID=A0A0K8NYW5_PISS1|nr:putative membrane protein [Piscinibacter sakaiensis]